MGSSSDNDEEVLVLLVEEWYFFLFNCLDFDVSTKHSAVDIRYFKYLFCLSNILSEFKGYPCYKMITSQNISSEVQVENFFIS